MARVLLILPTSSYRVADFIDAASGLGVEVAVAAEEELPLNTLDRFIKVDLSQPEVAAASIVELASTTPIDALVPVDDAGVMAAAIAAEALGLPHNPPWAAAATRNKVMMRRAFEKMEVPQPTFRVLGPTDDPAAAGDDVGYPLVIKPLSLSGSRGVIRVDDPATLAEVAERVRQINAVACRDPSEPLLLERFVPGPEIALEGVLRNGQLATLAIFDKPLPMNGPFFEETIYVTPSRLHPEVLDEVERVAAMAVKALELREGPVHAELRIESGQPKVIEVAARSIGGICGRALRFGLLGTSLEALIIRHALNRPLEPPVSKHTGKASGVMMLPIPSAGVLTDVDGVEEAESVTGVKSVEITAPIGTYLRPVPDADQYLGFVFATGDTPEDVVTSLQSAHDLLTISIS